MKRQILNLGAVTLFMTICLTFPACGSSDQSTKENQEHTEESHSMYQCPMKCEGDKTYAKEGSCPVCKMDLKKI